MSASVGHFVGRAACLLAVLWFCGCEAQKYPGGKDTLRSFGNGRFQISTTGHLSDAERNQTVVLRVHDWRKKGKELFLVSTHGEYTLVNYRTGAVRRFESLVDVPSEYRQVFEQLTVPPMRTFAQGRFRLYDDGDDGLALYDGDKGFSILFGIRDWRAEGERLFFITRFFTIRRTPFERLEEYATVDLKTGALQEFDRLEDAPDELRAVFKRLKHLPPRRSGGTP